MHVWIAVGVYVWINTVPPVTYDYSPAVATREECEAIVVKQRARNDAQPDMIGYALQCVDMDVIAKPVDTPAIPIPKPAFRLNTHTPGFDFWGKLFHDA